MFPWVLCALWGGVTPVDGSLLYLENCNSVVETTTRQVIGHVGLVFVDDNQAWVYEAAPSKVRRIAWSDYQTELARINARRKPDDAVRLWLLSPARPYSATERTAMRERLAQELGRRYSVANYVKGRAGDGIHCAELAATVLHCSGRYDIPQPHAVTPARLVEIVRPSCLPALRCPCPPPPAEPWCARTWRRWTELTAWCGWSCRESWAIAW